MLDTRLKHTFATIFLWAAMLLGLYYLKETHISYIISLSHYQMFNIPSISYTIMCFFHALFPLLLITPPLLFSRRAWLKGYFFAMGAFYLLGNTWIFYFLAQNPVSDLFNTAVLHQFQQSRALTLNYLSWATYDLWGVLFSAIQGAIYIYLGCIIDKRITKTFISYVAVTVNSLLFPLLYCFFTIGTSFEAIIGDETVNLYLNKNLMLIALDIFVSAAMFLASGVKGLWFELFIVLRGRRR